MIQEKSTPLEDVVQRLDQGDTTLLAGDIYNAIASAVMSSKSSKYRYMRRVDRCKMLLETYVSALLEQQIVHTKKSAVKRAYENFAIDVGHHPSKGTHAQTLVYRTWRSVLDKFQEQHHLTKAYWFDKRPDWR